MALLDLLRKDEQGADPQFLRDELRLLTQELMEAEVTEAEVAPFNGSALGSARAFLEDGWFEPPAWSPDGKPLPYVAPIGLTGLFQLLYLGLVVAATPTATASASSSPSSSGRSSSVVAPTLASKTKGRHRGQVNTLRHLHRG
jgi:hypothetical protein